MAPRQGRVIHRAVRRGRDSIGSGAFGSGEHLDLAGFWVETAIHAALSGEPKHPALIKRGGIEIHARTVWRQRKDFYRFGLGIDANDRVQAAVPNPRRAIWPDDD